MALPYFTARSNDHEILRRVKWQIVQMILIPEMKMQSVEIPI